MRKILPILKLGVLLFLSEAMYSGTCLAAEVNLQEMKCIIFDFDGTICNSHLFTLEALKKAFEEFDLNKEFLTEQNNFRDLTMRDLASKLNLPREKLQEVMTFVRNFVAAKKGEMSLCDGVEEALTQLKRNKYNLGILTSNGEETVTKFLTKHGLVHLFDFIFSNSHATFSKEEIIASLLKERQFDKKDVIYVGDETRDIEGAGKAGIPSIAVSWGQNSKQILTQYNPTFLVDSAEELVQLFNR